MGAVRMKALADLGHRRLQAVVIAAVLVLATASATIALDTLVESQAPFDRAFAAANGAHLVVDYNADVTAEQLASTAHAAPVTGSAGPWPVGPVGIVIVSPDVAKGGGTFFSIGEVSGRTDPGGAVDAITISEGRWWQRPGEVVVSQGWARTVRGGVGSTIVLRDAPPDTGGKGGASGAGPDGSPDSALVQRTFTVVGIAGSVSTPDLFGWISPSDVAALMPSQAPRQQMLYRVAPSATDADMAAALTSVTAGLPDGAVSNSQTYLAQKESVDRTASLFVPILLAFSVFALLAAAFIIANVVSGIVLTSYRDIGVMKAVGFTPLQVTGILLAQILVPVAVGAVLGVAIGTVASQPILADTARSFGLPAAVTLSAPVVGGVLLAAFATTVLAAIGPAIRAGRLSAVGAITRGTTPSARAGGGQLRAWLLELPLPSSVRVGVAAGLAHPIRAAMTLGALTVGVAALVFAVTMNASLVRIAGQLERDAASPIRVETGGGFATAAQPGPAGSGTGSGPAAAPDPRAIGAAITADVDTGRSVAIGESDVTVPQLGGPIPFVGYQGDASWLGYALINGRWFAGPGEAVAPTNFFATSGLHVGDTTTVRANGQSVRLTFVGEIFDQARENRDDLVLRGEWSDLVALDPGIQPTRWEVQPRQGVDPMDYRSGLSDTIGGLVSIEVVQDSRTDEGFLTFEGVISALGLVLIVISLGGVFNTVLLETRQRARETAVLKTIGMTPRQVVGMIVASVVPVGVVAGLLGVPLGIAGQRIVLGFMGRAASNTGVPESSLNVLPIVALLAMGLAGLAIGALGAWIPAQRAARSGIAEVLQTE